MLSWSWWRNSEDTRKPVAHEEGTPQGCVGKCHTQGRRQSSLGLLAMLSGCRGVQEAVHPSSVSLGGEP